MNEDDGCKEMIFFRHLVEHHGTDPVTWDSLARCALHDDTLSARQRLEKCVDLYGQGQERVDSNNERLDSMLIDTLFNAFNIVPRPLSVFLTKMLLTALEKADEKRILEESNYRLWVS
jgi:hypothetical protein